MDIYRSKYWIRYAWVLTFVCRACCDDGYGVLEEVCDNVETQVMDSNTLQTATIAAEAAYAGEPALVANAATGGLNTC